MDIEDDVDIDDNELVVVTRQKNDHKSGTVKRKNISGLHWGTTSGGAQVFTGTNGLYGYMNCTDIEEGEIGHSGIHGACPHEIKVYIPKGPNEKLYSYYGIKNEDM